MILYTRTICPKCMLVKNMLDGAEISYEALNLDTNETAENMLKEKGFMELPIAKINEEFYVGVQSIQKWLAENEK